MHRGTLEDRPVYSKSLCFDPFPFPVATPAQQARIRDLAEQIDTHRKRMLAAHDELTLTGLYNVLQKVGAGDTALTAKEKLIHEKGLVAVLTHMQDDLDAAVLAAYGWQDHPSDEQILERLVALNAERVAEEASGTIRWLRPAFQAPSSEKAEKGAEKGARLEFGEAVNSNQAPFPPFPNQAPFPPASLPAPARAPTQQQWPSSLPDQLAAVARILAESPSAQTEAQLAANFTGKGRWKSRLPDILEALAALGRARRLDDGRWLG